MLRSISFLLVGGLLLASLPPMAQATGGPFIVLANGTPKYAEVGFGLHTLRVSGTFFNSLPYADRVADAAYMTSAGQAGSCTSSPNLGLFVNGIKPSWGPCQAVTHTYTTYADCPYSRCVITMQIVDGFEGGLSDNEGFLTVLIDPGQGSNDPNLGCMTRLVYWCVSSFEDGDCWGWNRLLLDVYVVDVYFAGYRDCEGSQRTDYESLSVRSRPVLGNDDAILVRHYEGTYGCETGAWIRGVGTSRCVHTGTSPAWGRLLP